MKKNNARRAIAVLLAIVCLLTPAAQAAAPTVQTDEAVYINLDYYGQPQQTRCLLDTSDAADDPLRLSPIGPCSLHHD